MTPGKLTAGFLLIAALAAFSAWQLQSAAADNFAAARAFQSAEVPEDDSPPPSVDQNRAILDTLDESIEIRRRIDGLLGEVESLVGSLQESQAGAESVSQLVGTQLTGIASALGGAVNAADESIAGLRGLRDHLQTSAELAERIARELAKLDRKLGPSAGRP